MPQRKVILEELAALNSIKDLAQSYEEIAVVRMQKIKDSVLKTRDFLTRLSDVFVDLKSSYGHEIEELLKKIDKGDKSILPLLRKNGKTLLVYLSSNGRLYGAVTQKTYRLFIADVKANLNDKTDIVIIGSAGKEMYQNSGVKKPYDYFDIPDTTVDVTHIKKLMQKFLQYEQVHVYYGKFGNVIKQTPIATSITGDDIFETEVPHPALRDDKFIFEPTLEKILHFFETSIMANLFSQTLLENQLARHASRVNAMEEALANVEQESKRLNSQRTRLKHLTANKKQLEMMSGLVLWEA
jgi:ATP synthase F1 gamma subunit